MGGCWSSLCCYSVSVYKPKAPNCWAGGAGSISLPLLSPDSTTSDYVLLGHLKHTVYRDLSYMTEEVWGTITLDNHNIDEGTLKTSNKIMENRQCSILGEEREQIKHLMN